MNLITRRGFTLAGSVAFFGQQASAAPEVPHTIRDGETFNAVLSQATRPIAVDLWAVWCTPCRRFGPVFDSVATSDQYPGLTFTRLDVGETSRPLWQTLTQQYQFKFIPAVLLFGPGGKWLVTASGGVSTWTKSNLTNWLNRTLPSS